MAQAVKPGSAAPSDGPAVALREDVWSEAFLGKRGDALREYTEAEQLTHEDLEDGRGHFRQGAVFRRACSLILMA